MSKRHKKEKVTGVRSEKKETEKHARGTKLASSIENMNVCWHLGIIDLEGPFGWERINKDHLLEILEKAKGFETMTWSEVKAATHNKNKSNHHFVPISECTGEAKKRFKEKFPCHQRGDEIFCFRTKAKCRIWGIVSGHIFKVLWWDPNHLVCKSRSRQ